MASPEQQMVRTRSNRHPANILFAALVAVLSALAWPQGAAATIGSPAWYHAIEVIAAVNETPPEVPLLVLTGGSVSKECMVSDTDWAAQVQRRGGPEVVAYNISSAMRTFYEDVALVEALPNVPTIVFIGVNLGRFTWAFQSGEVSLARNPTLAAKYSIHHFTSVDAMTLAEKRACVVRWMTKSYPHFQSRVDYNLRRLAQMVRVCKRKGLHPVMLEMPRNMAVIGHAYDVPIRRFHRGCWAIAREYGVPYINFVLDARLLDRDFRDLGHLVESGRPKFQRLLSDKTIALLRRYGMTSPVDETPAASGRPFLRRRP
jgi:hypothetical protein